MKETKTVLVVAGLADSLINFRGPLIQQMAAKGHRVIATAAAVDSLSGSVSADVETTLKAWGVEFVPMPLDRTGTSIRADLETLKFLKKLIGEKKPDTIFTYTVKAVIYGCLAARLSHIPHRYALITGLSYGLRDLKEIDSKKGKLVRFLYQIGLKGSRRVIFQNPDDRDVFTNLGLVSQPTEIGLVHGSGVDLSKYPPSQVPVGPPVFLLIARLLKEKGIVEFAEAAKVVKAKHPTSRFVLIGPFDQHPTAIKKEQVDEWVSEGTLEYLGSKQDVKPYLAECTVYVLPSYREGTPRTVLEAMATGRAIITTDTAGCRETTTTGVNGTLVPVGDSSALAAAMCQLLDQPELITKYAQKSRRIAEEKYDVNKVNQAMLEYLEL